MTCTIYHILFRWRNQG